MILYLIYSKGHILYNIIISEPSISFNVICNYMIMTIICVTNIWYSVILYNITLYYDTKLKIEK